MKEQEKDAYERLPQVIRETAEHHGRQQGIPLAEVERQYDAAQLKINPGPSPWNNNVLTRGMKRFRRKR
ncbi:MAG: hypothetical protein ISS70_17750 [Phycisphaerae bacterium]|nr:hypothetical protein [Phycisphaerae bacterium]